MASADVIDLTGDSDDDGRLHRPRPTRSSQGVNEQQHANRPARIPLAAGAHLSRPEWESHPMLNQTRSSSSTSMALMMQRPAQPKNGGIPLPNKAAPSTGSLRDEIIDSTQLYAMQASAETLPARPASMKSHNDLPVNTKVICLNCASSSDVTCDGEQPCSACSEPGIECLYPGDHSHSLRLRPRQQTAESIAAKSTTHDHSFDEDGELEHSSNFDLDTLEGVSGLLRLHEARMHAHREYLLRPLLIRSKHDAINSPKPDVPAALPSPFLTFANRSDLASVEGRTAPRMTLQIKSHRATIPKKWATVTVPVTTVAQDSTILPKYKSIGRLGATVLARNSYVKKYMPYFADDVPDNEQKRDEDIMKWYQTDNDSMRCQRQCLEAVQLWKPLVEKFVSRLEMQLKDLLWYILNMSDNRKCQACDKSMKKARYASVLYLLEKPDDRSLQRARLATEALDRIAKIHMWHIVVELDIVKHLLDATEELRRPSDTLCSICFLHNCMTHGAFNEPTDDPSGTFAFMGGDGARRRPMMINDDEKDVNERVSTTVRYINNDSAHQCGLYCVDTTTPLEAVLGQKLNGKFGGVFNQSVHAPRPVYENFETCSPHCFWPVEKRTRFLTVAQTKSFEPNISAEERRLFNRLLRLYSSNQRAPCMIAQDVSSISCIDAFYLLLAKTQSPAHFEQARHELQQHTMRKLSKLALGIDTAMSSQLDERPPFIPCSHEGPCQNNAECTCAHDRVFCEFFCGCDASCKRRYQGCNCAGKGKACFNDDRCECWAQNRECDPWVCQSCGAVEVLDPANKYREEMRRGRCKNTNIQLELPARTIKAPSEVQGWGLYAGQDLEIHTFIGEYKGETVGNQESDRRGSIYHHLGQEYLFVTNNGQQIDGSNFGNKTRFINNSQRSDYINVLAKKLLCYGVQRVMLYAKRPIKAGDELLYNYNYPDSVTKTFWERGEGPARVAGAVVAKPALPTDGRIAKVADKQHRERSESSSRAPQRQIPGTPAKHRHHDVGASRSNAKRKRVSDGDSFANPGGTPTLSDEVHVRASGDSAEPEYQKDEGILSERGESNTDESTSEEDTVPVRQRRIHARDGRLGGSAQRKAWETRKNRARIISTE